jgi:hypothetical protein
MNDEKSTRYWMNDEKKDEEERVSRAIKYFVSKAHFYVSSGTGCLMAKERKEHIINKA